MLGKRERWGVTLVNVREWKRVKGRVDILRGEEREEEERKERQDTIDGEVKGEGKGESNRGKKGE